MLSPTARAAEPGSDDDQRNRDESRRRSGFDDDYPDDLKPRRSRRSGPRRDPQQPESYASPATGFRADRDEVVEIAANRDRRGPAAERDNEQRRDNRFRGTDRTPRSDRSLRRGRSAHAGSGSRRQRHARPAGLAAPLAVLLALVGGLVPALLDIWLTGRLGVLFSLGFVLSSFGVAAGIRRQDVFTAGILPPLAALVTFVGVGVIAPDRLLRTDGSNVSPVLAVLGGLAAESWTLVAASALALGTIALRVAFAQPRGDLSQDEPLEDPSATRVGGRRSGSRQRF